jgi:hypothetical protein
MSGFGQRENETTSNWLRRLIAEGAPAHIISATQAILEYEKENKQAGKYDYYILAILN